MTGWPLVILILGVTAIATWAGVAIYGITSARRMARGDHVTAAIQSALRGVEEADKASRERFEAERDRMNRDFESFRNGIRGDRQWRGRA